MKHVDSKTSLAELNPEDPTCFVCLEASNEEPVVSSAMLRNCGCTFVVHPTCWNEYMKGKTDFDCPICRKKSIFINRSPTPLQDFLDANPDQQVAEPVRHVPFKAIVFFGIMTVLIVTLIAVFLNRNN